MLQFKIVTPVTAALMHRTAQYLIAITPKCFALAAAAVSAKLRAILLNKICNILQCLRSFVNSAHDGQFYACWPIPHKMLCVQNHRILTSLTASVILTKCTLHIEVVSNYSILRILLLLHTINTLLTR